jgi:hypothetical protein
MLTAPIKHSTLIRQALGRSRNVRAKTKLALHPLDDRRQYQERVLIGFAKPDVLYSLIRIKRRLWRLPLHDDADETCTLGIGLLDSLSDRRLQMLARN